MSKNNKKNIKKNFISLYDKYHESIYRFLRFRVSEDEIAQDLTSETFTKAWDSVATSDTQYPSNERAYLYKIANNLLIDYYRSAQKNREVNIDNADVFVQLASTQTKDVEQSVGDRLDISKNMDSVFMMLQGLSELTVQAITLKYVEDMSNAEIAQILGKSEGAVRTIISRGLTELRNKLDTAD